MCGIFGAVDLDGFFSPSDYGKFVGLTDMVSYRGPNSAGYECLRVKSATIPASERWDVFLGHRRLSIIDLSDAGRQPMTDGQGRWLIFNGEIFNFVELRQELEQLGESFITATDSEVLLRIYARYGLDGFAKLNGMWAFALVDLSQRRVILSRDRFSIKPLYYTRQGSRIYFASEIKQLLPLLPSRRLNEDAMSAFLAQLLLDHSADTFFQGISRVPAKTSVIVSLDDGGVSSHQYWDFEPEPMLAYEDAANRFRELMEDSVRIRLRSDVKVGCMLSGGLDSSTIALMCHQLRADNVETFSVVSDDRRYSEESFIDVVNSCTGVRNHKLVFRCPDLLQVLHSVLVHNDEPVSSFSVVAQYSIFQLIKQQTDVTVLLSGQGGDEILLGYSKFFFLYVNNLLRQGSFLAAANELFASLVRGTVVRQFRFSDARRYIPWLDTNSYGGALRSSPTYVPVPIWEPRDLRRRQIADIDRYSVPALAHFEDRNSMAHSLEARHPFLDHRLVNFVTSLPTAYKIRNGWTKYILRDSMAHLPKAIRWRKDKQGFITAEEKWIREDLRSVIRGVFRNSQLGQLGVLDQRKFLDYYERFLKGQSSFFLDICRAFIAEMWVRSVLLAGPAPLGPLDSNKGDVIPQLVQS
ncbi:MAG: asparagine synthase (glutamine-hydrolyzing) [Terriglobales bacterium]